jgi:hypothetical protein
MFGFAFCHGAGSAHCGSRPGAETVIPGGTFTSASALAQQGWASETVKNASAGIQEIRLKPGRGAARLIHHCGVKQNRAPIGEWAARFQSATAASCRAVIFHPACVRIEVFPERLSLRLSFGEGPFQIAAEGFEELFVENVAQLQFLGFGTARYAQRAREQPAHFCGDKQQCLPANDRFHFPQALNIGHNLEALVALGISPNEFVDHRIPGDRRDQQMGELSGMGEKEFSARWHRAQAEAFRREAQAKSASDTCK